jgi:hypothetical protein
LEDIKDTGGSYKGLADQSTIILFVATHSTIARPLAVTVSLESTVDTLNLSVIPDSSTFARWNYSVFLIPDWSHCHSTIWKVLGQKLRKSWKIAIFGRFWLDFCYIWTILEDPWIFIVSRICPFSVPVDFLSNFQLLTK